MIIKILKVLKNIVIPVALIVLAFATYKIYKNMTGGNIKWI